MRGSSLEVGVGLGAPPPCSCGTSAAESSKYRRVEAAHHTQRARTRGVELFFRRRQRTARKGRRPAGNRPSKTNVGGARTRKLVPEGAGRRSLRHQLRIDVDKRLAHPLHLPQRTATSGNPQFQRHISFSLPVAAVSQAVSSPHTQTMRRHSLCRTRSSLTRLSVLDASGAQGLRGARLLARTDARTWIVRPTRAARRDGRL